MSDQQRKGRVFEKTGGVRPMPPGTLGLLRRHGVVIVAEGRGCRWDLVLADGRHLRVGAPR